MVANCAALPSPGSPFYSRWFGEWQWDPSWWESTMKLQRTLGRYPVYFLSRVYASAFLRHLYNLDMEAQTLTFLIVSVPSETAVIFCVIILHAMYLNGALSLRYALRVRLNSDVIIIQTADGIHRSSFKPSYKTTYIGSPTFQKLHKVHDTYREKQMQSGGCEARR